MEKNQKAARVMTNYHLVILKKPYLDAILAGRKTIESRFTKTKRHWFGRVNIGDRLFLKLRASNKMKEESYL